MAKFVATIKAIITRLVFAAHGFIGIWQVTIFKNDDAFWYLSSPILLLFFEGVFTLTIKENQEWKWFCPSVFLYLASIVPAIWLLELDKVERRLKVREETLTNLTANANFKDLHNLIGVQLPMPQITTETWITLVEQFLMLILIIGRWMLPKGDLTRDQLSQLLLVYIGTAADIIEFFDSFKDDKIAAEPILVLLTLAIWSWSLMQFTVVLTATKSRKSRLSSTGVISKTTNGCCTIDVWGIALNITLQDAPFLVFRLLLITHFQIISYMNVFFTCKNTLVILLQLYRLYVVYSESHKKLKKKKRNEFELTNISIISKPDMYRSTRTSVPKRSSRSSRKEKRRYVEESDRSESEVSEVETRRSKLNSRKDTGYSTASSHNSHKHKIHKVQSGNSRRGGGEPERERKQKEREKSREKLSKHSSKSSVSEAHREKKLQRSDRETKINIHEESEVSGSEYISKSEESRKSNKSKHKKDSKQNYKETTSISTSTLSTD